MKNILITVCIFLIFAGYATSVSGNDDLIKAAYDGDIEKVKQYISNRVNVNYRNEHGNTALLLALDRRKSFVPIAELLLKSGADPNLASNDGRTPLINAVCAGGPLKAIRMLIDFGAVIDKQDIDGSTALIEAAKYGYADIALLLIENGAGKSLINNDGQNALSIAEKENRKDVVSAIVDGSIPISTEMLFNAAITGNAPEIVRQVDNGIKVNAIEGERKWTPLINATWFGRAEAVRALIDKGANVNKKSGKDPIYIYHGWAPLHFAAENNYGEIAEILLRNGAKRNQPTDEGHTALSIAEHNDAKTVIAVLINPDIRGANSTKTLYITMSISGLVLLIGAMVGLFFYRTRGAKDKGALK